jgi:hypothetical protein
MAKQRKRRKAARQLALTERGQTLPQWATLPEETRREVVALLVELLRSHGDGNAEEVSDE